MGGPGHSLGADRWGDSTELVNRGACGSGYRQLQAKVDAGLRKETDLASNYRQTKLGVRRGLLLGYCPVCRPRLSPLFREQTGVEREVGGREGGLELCYSSAVSTQPQPRGGDWSSQADLKPFPH